MHTYTSLLLNPEPSAQVASGKTTFSPMRTFTHDVATTQKPATEQAGTSKAANKQATSRQAHKASTQQVCNATASASQAQEARPASKATATSIEGGAGKGRAVPCQLTLLPSPNPLQLAPFAPN
jgi:hypothetical protein